jgi:predicted dehydrogenase
VLRATAVAAPWLGPAAVRGANDRLTFGMIGTGNRGRWLQDAFQKVGAQCVALCDVYQPHLELARKNAPAGVKTFVDYGDLLQMPGLDFVVVATADHHHRPALLAALEAKKDVYLEKPVSLNLAESQVMVEAVKRSPQIVQIGMQRRSMGFVRAARQFIQDGGLGEISLVEAAWNWHFALWSDNRPLEGEIDWKRFLGPAPERPLEPRRFRWWRGFWDYSGGNMTDQGTHLMDVVQWMTASGPPLSATCSGKIVNETGVEVPNIFTAAFEYPKFLASWTLDYRSAYEHDWSITFRGEKATMVMDRRGYRLYDNPGASPAPWTQRPATAVSKEVPDDSDARAHQQNLLECIQTRKQPNCPIEVAAEAVAGPHMANVAYREGRKVVRG